ncbi:MAG TPA: YkgJ family cysteine cluster protein, partial [Polyangiaceae bacterium]|nr:YkgJ family cysteine cluster protein [Polyangiaceae bacterium]
MARAKALRIVYPETQKYACRDCPARCCRTPWGIPVTPEVALVMLNDSELRGRLTGRAPGVLAGGTLPMREQGGVLQCVFLDDDDLCAVQKRHGHAALPRACQAYPFGFVHDENGAEVALLSRHCPSIRDNYGEPLAGQIQQKFEQAGGSRPLAPRMGLGSGRTLPTALYLQVVDSWKQLILAGSPMSGLIHAYFTLDAFDAACQAQPSAAAVGAALDQAAATPSAPLVPSRRPNFAARL